MITIKEEDFPGLYQCADATSMTAQKNYYRSLAWYSISLFAGALFSFFATAPEPSFKITSVILFLISLFLMIWQKFSKPEDTWYNGRAVAESVKTRTWRFMMKAEPFEANEEVSSKVFIADLKEILKQNESLMGKLNSKDAIKEPISQQMIAIRNLSLEDRLNFYKTCRIEDQEKWYTHKATYNKEMSGKLFGVTVFLHIIAILLLLYNIKDSTLRFPISVIGVAASSILSWTQAKKHNELSSSYSLTAHEIVIIKNEVNVISDEHQLSDYVINCETAFSREHTQWIAKKKK